jgi:hypothetical protein
VTLRVISIQRIEGGTIAQEWGVGDMLGLMQQLGVGQSLLRAYWLRLGGVRQDHLLTATQKE